MFKKDLESVKTTCPPPLSFNWWNTLKLQDFYIRTSKSKEDKRKDFAKNKWFQNTQTGEVVKMKNINLDRMLQDKAKKAMFAVQQIQEENKDMLGIFLTLTLPPWYHSKIKGIVNINFNEETINDGIEILKKAETIIRKKFHKRFKRSVKYIRIIEPHADLTPHSHVQYWLKESEIKKAKEYIKNTIEHMQQINKLGKQCKLVVLEDTENSNISAYVSKYIHKTLDDQSHSAKIRIIDGWNRHHKIRMFSHSRTKVPKRYYNMIVNLADNIKPEYDNLGQYALDKVKYVVIQKYFNEVKITNKNMINNFDILIRRITQKYQKRNMQTDFIEKTVYQHLETTFYKNFELKHNSKWWILITENEEVEFQFLEPFSYFLSRKIRLSSALELKTIKKYNRRYTKVFKYLEDSIPPRGCLLSA
jgi:hypothetical protein